MTAGQEDDLDLAHDRALTEMLSRLHDPSRFEPIAEPALFQGQLREYQKRGVSWLQYLETLGLNGCLADDMGLGKSAQVIARLVQEREQASQNHKQTVLPTLLIAPTSVVGNWQKEIEKFAPHLRAIAHHGSQRQQDQAEFRAALGECDVVITSFTLARKDAKLLESIDWHRLVVDEAQNIKNPKAAQTKAILKLPAQHRLALTGTPVENRLLDLWSIFNFLNPGYLGKEAQFRQSFEVPIQKNNDRVQARMLKKLVEPFILRRVKTDQSIIKDLPDKLEQKQYCNLSKEQASLYQVVVKDIEGQLEEAEGIQRKGMILATLMKLKQICNHPMQFLQDGSEFSPERSHKLSRLSEMAAEAIAEGESMLIFTQFTEIGAALERFLKPTANTFYLHGGTSSTKRQQMISQFQDPETEPSVFILSLKAGGVGITLTKANHVFHFDRWWNPAVEDQATDRAFRIGQKKNVFVHKFVAIGTLEEKIDQMIEDKKKLAGAIVGADESWLTELDNNAFKQLIALQKTAVME
jgi:SNF2 family DNA or RNA helicase